MTHRDQLLATVQSLSGSFAAQLAVLVAMPTESQNPARAAALRDYLGHMQARLARSGFAGDVWPNPDGPPLLVMRRIEDPDLPTVLVYGHGDVIRAQESMWEPGLAPFALTQREDRLYGRGTADNKGQHLINLLAMEAVLEARGALGVNMTWLIEMGEEVGSPGLDRFCAAHRSLLDADVLIASDGPRVRADVPTVFLGARGSSNFDLTVDLREGAHHSGNWGGLLADPAIILAQALACITDARGAIRVPGWRPDSLTGALRQHLAALPAPGTGGPSVDPDWGEPGLSAAEKVYGWNSFAVLAMTAGQPEAPVNAINGQARATCQLRFVVGTEPERILPDLRAHLDAHGFDMVQIAPLREGYFPATRAALDNPWVRRVAASVETTLGTPPDLLPNLGGSLPNHVFARTLDLPTVWVPHSYSGCSQHAPNEHALLSLCTQALQVMAGIYWDIGDSRLS